MFFGDYISGVSLTGLPSGEDLLLVLHAPRVAWEESCRNTFSECFALKLSLRGPSESFGSSACCLLL
jgi:hypothetical protein